MLSKRWLGMTIRVSTLCFQFFDAFFGLAHALLAFKDERLGHHADRQRADFARHAREHRRAARAGATAHPGGDKDHVGAFEVLPNHFLIFQRRAPADLRIGARRPSLWSPVPPS